MNPTPLDADWLNQHRRPHLPDVVVSPSLPSTNDAIKAQWANNEPGTIWLADEQTQGRGRRGRTWLSPPGGGLYLSMPHQSEHRQDTLPAFGLVLALAVAKAVPDPVWVKWPNDIVIRQDRGWAKVGGCLIDVSISPGAPVGLILGVGLNLALQAHLGSAPHAPPDQAWADLAHVTDRNALALNLIHQLDDDLRVFEAEGLAPFLARWDALDILKGQTIAVLENDHPIMEGVAVGINALGQLGVEANGATEWLNHGDVSIRPSQRL